jgi:hypothetical protein
MSSGLRNKKYYFKNQQYSKEEYQKVKEALDVKNFKLPIAKWVETKDMTKEEKDIALNAVRTLHGKIEHH